MAALSVDLGLISVPLLVRKGERQQRIGPTRWSSHVSQIPEAGGLAGN
jgi:hypothetical protein